MGSKWLKRAGIVLGALLTVMVALWTFFIVGGDELFAGASTGVAAAPGAAFLVVPVLIVGIPVGVWLAIRNW